jgi:hypothetical protein
MRARFFAIACLVIAVATATAQEKKTPSTPKAAKSSVSDLLMHHERALFETLQKEDFASFSAMVMPGSWSVDENGFMTIDEFLKMVKDPKAGFKYDSFQFSDMKVIALNPTASLVAYKLDSKGTFMGQAFPPTVYASTIWVNHGGTWHAMYHQESTAAKK